MEKVLILMSFLAMSCQTTPEYYPCKKCPAVNVFDFPEEHTWQDVLALKQAEKTCKRKGKCLLRFYLITNGNYHAVCGPKEETFCRIKQ